MIAIVQMAIAWIITIGTACLVIIAAWLIKTQAMLLLFAAAVLTFYATYELWFVVGGRIVKGVKALFHKKHDRS